MVDKKDDKDILMKSSILTIIKLDNRGLLTDYKFIKNKIIYNKV